MTVNEVSISTLRATAYSATSVLYYTNDAGAEGFWYQDQGDTTSPDNTGTVIVGTGSPAIRFKRVISGDYYITWFGADTASGDNTSAINAALANGKGGNVRVPMGQFIFTGQLTIPDNTNLLGEGYNSHLKPSNVSGNTILCGSNVEIKNMRLEGSTPGGIRVNGGAQNVLISQNFFSGIGQVVWLWDCTNITVSENTFDGTGYGVIQEGGHISSHVKVVNNTAKNMYADFVEANCTFNAPSEDWIITGNQYLGSVSYPSSVTEERFVGITAVQGVIISNNTIKHSAGDAAVHLEDIRGGIIIEGNYFEDCTGDYPYIYLTNSQKDVIISNNWFVRLDTSLSTNWVMNLGTNFYDAKITFANNHIKGASNNNLYGICVNYNTHVSILGNKFINCNKAIEGNNSNHIKICNNELVSCTDGIVCDPGPSGGQMNFVQVLGNSFDCSNNNIYVVRNTNGTGPSQNWIVSGNYFNNDAWGYDTNHFLVYGNMIASGKTLDLGATMYIGSSNYSASNNMSL